MGSLYYLFTSKAIKTSEHIEAFYFILCVDLKAKAKKPYALKILQHDVIIDWWLVKIIYKIKSSDTTEKAVKDDFKKKGIKGLHTVGEKAKSQLRDACQWTAGYILTHTWHAATESSQCRSLKLSSKPTWTYRKHKEANEEQWKVSVKEMNKGWTRKWEMAPSPVWLEV